MTWHPIAYQQLIEKNYHSAVVFYEQVLETESEEISHYWYLGLACLLDEQEDAAQTTWLFAMSQGSDEEVLEWTLNLTDIIETEAHRQRQEKELHNAWLLRQHLREINPDYINNLLLLVEISIELELFDVSCFKEWKLTELLHQAETSVISSVQLLSTLQRILCHQPLSDEAINFTKPCLKFIDDKSNWIDKLLMAAIKIGDVMEKPSFAADLVEICLEIDENNLQILGQLSRLTRGAKRYKRSIEISEKYYQISETLEDRFLSNNNLLGALTQAGAWLKVDPILQRHRELLNQLLALPPNDLSIEIKQSLIASTAIFTYHQDNLPVNRDFHNKVGNLFRHEGLRYSFQSRKIDQNRPLRIGYIGHTLRRHSVGWLSRWLFSHHDRAKFHISVYLVNDSLVDDFYEEWFASKVDNAHAIHIDALDIADQIYKDEIDILVDLDSITLNVTYTTLSFKPAPIQVSWLGWDAPGLHAVDYFIADPYVLPEEASQFYQEKIWRLPQTYVAVDGFEISVPTIRREDLGIPNDAVVFLSAQTGMKRHPDTIRLQLQILKEVPNSYLIIKGLGDDDAVKEVFIHMANEAGIDFKRLCFRSLDATEYDHRANLQIADVVLDTYPYNGATTTLEALWVGVPLVTKTGKTFSSRNTYGFLQNVGVSEGIAWSDNEYVEWGVRLGRDEDLRRKISWKLRQSRRTSPLWNAKKFTRDMESAYLQMYSKYAESQVSASSLL
jgi:predicted O-linked N-acetylglucosamine transferase (SPINDLY family)